MQRLSTTADTNAVRGPAKDAKFLFKQSDIGSQDEVRPLKHGFHRLIDFRGNFLILRLQIHQRHMVVHSHVLILRQQAHES